MQTENQIDWKVEYLKQKEYSAALEHTRADLMGVNEELRLKIASLERGQADLLRLPFTRFGDFLNPLMVEENYSRGVWRVVMDEIRTLFRRR